MQSLFISPNSSEPSLHILTGSFRSLSLFLLVFSPLHRTLSHVQSIAGYGPHQYLASNPHKDRVYTTSWAIPPQLDSWRILRNSEPWRVEHVNSVPITAVSSYINIPPPFTHAYSAGGPTGEVHSISSTTGGFGPKIQELVFVAPDDLATADKSRVALRTGSHGIEFVNGRAFIPVLGSNRIEMYSVDPVTDHLTHMFSAPSPRSGSSNDAPRHVKAHPNGEVLYCVTEHANTLDVYKILPTSLHFVSSHSLLPSMSEQAEHGYRGDTLLLTPPTPNNPAPQTIFATTRGGNSDTKGWLSVHRLDSNGLVTETIEYYQTPTSGGKANALDLYPKALLHHDLPETDGEPVWILLTDDDDSAASAGAHAVRVLEWNGVTGGGIQQVAAWPQEGDDSYTGKDENSSQEVIRGASHAIFLP